MVVKSKNPLAGFLEGMKKSGIPGEIVFAAALDIITDASPAKLKTEYESDFAVPLLFSLALGPFEIPDENVDGLLRFALAQDGKPVGINSEECHVLIAGQTWTGKSTLLKIIFAQAILFSERTKGSQNNGKHNLLDVRKSD